MLPVVILDPLWLACNDCMLSVLIKIPFYVLLDCCLAPEQIRWSDRGLYVVYLFGNYNKGTGSSLFNELFQCWNIVSFVFYARYPEKLLVSIFFSFPILSLWKIPLVVNKNWACCWVYMVILYFLECKIDGIKHLICKCKQCSGYSMVQDFS